MSAFIPPSRSTRKPGLPSPKLDIPWSSSSSSSRDGPSGSTRSGTAKDPSISSSGSVHACDDASSSSEEGLSSSSSTTSASAPASAPSPASQAYGHYAIPGVTDTTPPSTSSSTTHPRFPSHHQTKSGAPKLSLNLAFGSPRNGPPSNGDDRRSSGGSDGRGPASTSQTTSASYGLAYDSVSMPFKAMEQLSLVDDIDKDRTLRPGLVQIPVPPAASLAPTSSLSTANLMNIPRPSSGKPKLGLQTSRSASPANVAALDAAQQRGVGGGSSSAAQSAGSATESVFGGVALMRSTSFEGQLLDQVNSISEDQMKLSNETLQDLGKLGEGASGEVRKVRHLPTGMVMAKKTIPASPNEDVQKQILRELAFNRECRADWITRYYGAFLEDSDSQIAICMEYCEGGSLDAIYRRIKERQGRTGEKVLGKVAESVLKGLSYLHERKIIHRDIKPSNILVTRNGMIKLCDFGISGELINSMAGTFCGTSYYMAPERIRGARYTITADIWSLGLTIHEVAMNRFPFPPEGEPPLGPIELLSYIVHMDTPELKDDPAQGVKWTKAIQDFVRLCLVKDPAQRPGPTQLLQHSWMKKSETWHPDLAAWVAQVWEW